MTIAEEFQHGGHGGGTRRATDEDEGRKKWLNGQMAKWPNEDWVWSVPAKVEAEGAASRVVTGRSLAFGI